jgi:hypothetical protein
MSSASEALGIINRYLLRTYQELSTDICLGHQELSTGTCFGHTRNYHLASASDPSGTINWHPLRTHQELSTGICFGPTGELSTDICFGRIRNYQLVSASDTPGIDQLVSASGAPGIVNWHLLGRIRNYQLELLRTRQQWCVILPVYVTLLARDLCTRCVKYMNNGRSCHNIHMFYIQNILTVSLKQTKYTGICNSL